MDAYGLDELNRFQTDLEFLQSLSNPNYIECTTANAGISRTSPDKKQLL